MPAAPCGICQGTGPATRRKEEHIVKHHSCRVWCAPFNEIMLQFLEQLDQRMLPVPRRWMANILPVLS